jgi:hypothetical protein
MKTSEECEIAKDSFGKYVYSELKYAFSLFEIILHWEESL